MWENLRSNIQTWASRPELLGHTNLWYIAALENATWYAGVQGKAMVLFFLSFLSCVVGRSYVCVIDMVQL